MKTINSKKDFPFFDNKDNVVYLDNAATTQKPKVVLDAMTNYYTQYCCNIHRGSHDLGNIATTQYENARKNIANFIGANPKEIVFTKGATEALNFVAHSFVRYDFGTVILSQLEHHSNILPWQHESLNIEVIPMDEDLNIDIDAFTQLVKEHPKSFVSITHVSNSFGIVNFVKQLISIAHEYQCMVLIDGAQALTHEAIDVKDLDADFYVLSAHKAYGPTGVGLLYGKYELLCSMKPYQVGGGMVKDVSFHHAVFVDPPQRFEAGTQPIAEVIGFSAAIDYLKNTSNYKEQEQILMAYAKEELLKIEGVQLYTNAINVCGNISFNVEKLYHNDIVTLLSKQNIILRTGHLCAMPIMKKLGIDGTIRLSFALYNTKEDINMSIKALKRAIRILS